MPARRRSWFGKDSPIKTAADLKGKRLAGTRGGWGQFLIDATLEKAGYKTDEAIFAPLGPVDAKIALVAGSIDGWAVWEPYVSYATLKDNARVVADGEGLTPTITFIVASDSGDRHQARRRAGPRATAQQGAAMVAGSPARIRQEHRRTDQAAGRRAAQRLHRAKTSPIVIDTAIVQEVQHASDRATRYGILGKTLDVGKAVDRSFTAAAAASN